MRFKDNDVYETITLTCSEETVENDDGTTTVEQGWLWNDAGEVKKEIPPCEVSRTRF